MCSQKAVRAERQIEPLPATGWGRKRGEQYAPASAPSKRTHELHLLQAFTAFRASGDS